MNEVCPICSDIMLEINAMFDREYLLTMENLLWSDIVLVRDSLVVMYTAESVVHFITRWNLLKTGISNGHGGPVEGQVSEQYRKFLDL